MCHPTCRDHRPPAPGVAAEVATLLERKRIPPAAMTAELATLSVARFRDLCYSHAASILTGLKYGVLEDDLRAHAAEIAAQQPQPDPPV